MKYTLILLLAVAMLVTACKSQEMVPAEQPPVEEEPIVEPEPEPEPPGEEIRVVEERFTFEKEEDEVTHEENMFFVIVGSFIQKDNAERFMETLRGQGFDPVILMSETGFHRVSVGSYEKEIPARTRIQQVRNNYPDYHDTWLLIRKL